MEQYNEQYNKEDYIKVVSRSLAEKPGVIKKFIDMVFFVEILKGMKLTFTTMFKKPVTIRYPKVYREAAPGFRGLHALARRPLTGKPRCVGCGLCAAICPSRCITIYTSEGKNNEKVVDRYEIEVLKCLYCGLCVEACPFQAICLTEHYDYAAFSRDSLYMVKEQLLENWDKYMSEDKGKRYYEQFWGPKKAAYETHEDQAVFKGKNKEGL